MIKSLRLENFQSHKDSTFEFPPNLSVIVGSSNQGKTSIVRAFSLMLYNQWDSSWTRIGASFCKITLTMDSGVIVVREKGLKINRYILKIPSQPDQIFENFGVNTPEAIQKVLNIRKIELDKDDSLILNMSFQLDSLFLFNRSGSQKAKVLGRLSGAHFLDHALRNLNTEKKQISIEKNLKVQELEDLKVQHAALSAVSEFRPKIEELETKNAALDAARQRLDTLQSLFKRAQDWKKRYTSETAKESILAQAKAVEIDPVATSVQRLKVLKQLFNWKSDLEGRDNTLISSKKQLDIEFESATIEYVRILDENRMCPVCFTELDSVNMTKIKENLVGKETAVK